MNRRFYLILGVIVFASIALAFFTLTRGQSWVGDDFAGYILQAKSILAWNMDAYMRENSFTILTSSYPLGPIAYPWGFPLLLAPFYAVFGLNALALKLINLVFYAVFLISLAVLARTRLSDWDALLLTAFLGFLPALVGANDLILSDIPFLAFSTLGLALIERQARQIAGGILTGAVIFMAFFIRTNGVLLLAPLVLTPLISEWPDWKNALKKVLPAVLTFGGLAALQAVLFPGGQSSYLTHFSMFSPQRLLDNALYYAKLPAQFLDQLPWQDNLYILGAVLMLFSLIKRLRRDAAMHAYGLLTVLLFIVWPERQGLRFIFPVFPFACLAVLDGMHLAAGLLRADLQGAGQKLVSGLFGLLVVVCLGISAISAWQVTAGGREINGPFDQYSYQVFEYLRENTPNDSVIIFRKPRAMHLFTGRPAFMTDNCAELGKGNYAVVSLKAEDGQVAPEQVGACNPALRLDQVFQNKRFAIYKISS